MQKLDANDAHPFALLFILITTNIYLHMQVEKDEKRTHTTITV